MSRYDGFADNGSIGDHMGNIRGFICMYIYIRRGWAGPVLDGKVSVGYTYFGEFGG